MLEKDIESRVCRYAKTLGIDHYKFSSPARAAVPDRIHLARIPEFLRPLIAKYIRFVEYKQTGKKPTAPQIREHARLRELGFAVDVIDNVEDGENVMGEMGDNVKS